jgi:hypothetical protein
MDNKSADKDTLSGYNCGEMFSIHVDTLAALDGINSGSQQLLTFFMARYQKMRFGKLTAKQRAGIWDECLSLRQDNFLMFKRIIATGIKTGEFGIAGDAEIILKANLMLSIMSGIDEGIILCGEMPPTDSTLDTIVDFFLRCLGSKSVGGLTCIP